MTRIIRRPEVEAMTGLKRSMIYSEMQAGRFPLQVQIGRQAVGWSLDEVVVWITARVAARKPAHKSGPDLAGVVRKGRDGQDA